MLRSLLLIGVVVVTIGLLIGVGQAVAERVSRSAPTQVNMQQMEDESDRLVYELTENDVVVVQVKTPNACEVFAIEGPDAGELYFKENPSLRYTLTDPEDAEAVAAERRDDCRGWS